MHCHCNHVHNCAQPSLAICKSVCHGARSSRRDRWAWRMSSMRLVYPIWGAARCCPWPWVQRSVVVTSSGLPVWSTCKTRACSLPPSYVLCPCKWRTHCGDRRPARDLRTASLQAHLSECLPLWPLVPEFERPSSTRPSATARQLNAQVDLSARQMVLWLPTVAAQTRGLG
jgi:hypothetical protein